MENWKDFFIEEIADITSSKRIFQSDYVKSGIPFYRGKEIIEKAKGTDISTELFISNEKYEEINSKFGSPSSGDVLLTAVGTLGVPYRVTKSDMPFYFKDGNLIWFKEFTKHCNSRYFLFWLQSKIGQRVLEEITIGSTQKALTIASIKKSKINLPPLPEQKAIAGVLSALDDKIELNRQMNETLEAMARALFKDWFVDFGPTRAKMADQPAYLAPELWALFPDRLGDDGLPEGWEEKPLKYFSDFKNGFAFKSAELGSENKSGYPVIKMGNLIIGGGLDTDKFKSYYCNDLNDQTRRALAKKGDILMCMTDMKATMNLLGHTGIVEDDDKYLINQRVGIIRTKYVDGMSPYSLYLLTNSDEFIKVIRSKANSGVQVNLSKQSIIDMPVLSAGVKINQAFSSVVTDLFSKINANLQENKTLSKLRDTLLPKLISGQVRVKVAEAFIDEALNQTEKETTGAPC